MAQSDAKRYFMTMIQPLGARLLCKPIETDETLPQARIILLEDTREALTSEQCEVVAVGPEVADITPGDWLLHRPYTRLAGPDGQFWLTTEDVIAKLEVA